MFFKIKFYFKDLLLLFMRMCVLPAWVYVHHIPAGAHRCQRAVDPLGLELQAVISCLMWVPGIKPTSSTRAISPALKLNLSFDIFIRIYSTSWILSPHLPLSPTSPLSHIHSHTHVFWFWFETHCGQPGPSMWPWVWRRVGSPGVTKHRPEAFNWQVMPPYSTQDILSAVWGYTPRAAMLDSW